MGSVSLSLLSNGIAKTMQGTESTEIKLMCSGVRTSQCAPQAKSARIVSNHVTERTVFLDACMEYTYGLTPPSEVCMERIMDPPRRIP